MSQAYEIENSLQLTHRHKRSYYLEKFKPLIGFQLSEFLRLTSEAVFNIDHSNLGGTAGALFETALKCPNTLPDELKMLGLRKDGSTTAGDRDGYPDLRHESGDAHENKVIHAYDMDHKAVTKTRKSDSEACARLKVTSDVVNPRRDFLLVLAWAMKPIKNEVNLYSPKIMDFDVFPVINCVVARDNYLLKRGGLWINGSAVVLSRLGQSKIKRGEQVDATSFGNGKDYKRDTNQKIGRIPYKPLINFISKYCGVQPQILKESHCMK